MDLSPHLAATYLRHPLEQLLAVAERVGDDAVNERPHGEGTNSVASLVVHCCGVVEFWMGHVASGRPTGRDRDAEFTATATLAELRSMVASAVARAVADVEALAARSEPLGNDARLFLLGADGTDDDLVLYVVHELYQHLGHAEVTADAIAAAG